MGVAPEPPGRLRHPLRGIVGTGYIAGFFLAQKKPARSVVVVPFTSDPGQYLKGG